MTAYRTSRIPISFFSLNVFPLVGAMLPLADTDINLDAAAPPVAVQRNQRMPSLLHLSLEFEDFLPVQQQPPAALGFVVVAVSALVRRDVDVAEVGVSILYVGIPADKADVPLANGLDLGPTELKTRLDTVDDMVLVERPTMGRDDFATSALG
jgi:hypothetical protein